MNDDKFKKLSDEEMEVVSGGGAAVKKFSVKRLDGIFSRWGVMDQDGQLYSTSFFKSSSEEDCDYLTKKQIYLGLKEAEVQAETYKMLHEEHQIERMQS